MKIVVEELMANRDIEAVRVDVSVTARSPEGNVIDGGTLSIWVPRQDSIKALRQDALKRLRAFVAEVAEKATDEIDEEMTLILLL